MTECVLCHKTLGHGTKPRTIIDWETVEIKGQAHTGCVNKLNLVRRYCPEHIPTQTQLQFATKLKTAIEEIEERNKDRPWRRNLDFSRVILAGEGLFKFNNGVQWANSRRVKDLMNHWLNGSNIIDQKQYDKLKEWMLSFDTSDSRIKAETQDG